MFRRLREAADGKISFQYDGRKLVGYRGDTVAAALLAAGVVSMRTAAVSDGPRGPYCMMGACFDCLVMIDGVGNRQACLVEIEAGMRIESQRGNRDARR